MRLLQILIAIDQLLNTLLTGWADETLSSRAWRLRNRKTRWAIARRLIDAMFFWEPEHCRKSYDSEMERRQLPAEYKIEK